MATARLCPLSRRPRPAARPRRLPRMPRISACQSDGDAFTALLGARKRATDLMQATALTLAKEVVTAAAVNLDEWRRESAGKMQSAYVPQEPLAAAVQAVHAYNALMESWPVHLRDCREWQQPLAWSPDVRDRIANYLTRVLRVMSAAELADGENVAVAVADDHPERLSIVYTRDV